MKSQQVNPIYNYLSTFFVLFSALFLSAYHLKGENLKTRSISAADYCDFLNQAATDDQCGLYNKIMGSDANDSSIVRSGNPGNYHYEVVAGKEEAPVTYVSGATKIIFSEANGLQEADQNENQDPSLASNQELFSVILRNQGEQLSLAITPAKNSSLINKLTSWPTLVAAVALGGFFSKCCTSDAGSEHGDIADLNNPLLGQPPIEERSSYGSTQGSHIPENNDHPVDVPFIPSPGKPLPEIEQAPLTPVKENSLATIIEGSESGTPTPVVGQNQPPAFPLRSSSPIKPIQAALDESEEEHITAQKTILMNRVEVFRDRVVEFNKSKENLAAREAKLVKQEEKYRIQQVAASTNKAIIDSDENLLSQINPDQITNLVELERQKALVDSVGQLLTEINTSLTEKDASLTRRERVVNDKKKEILQKQEQRAKEEQRAQSAQPTRRGKTPSRRDRDQTPSRAESADAARRGSSGIKDRNSGAPGSRDFSAISSYAGETK